MTPRYAGVMRSTRFAIAREATRPTADQVHHTPETLRRPTEGSSPSPPSAGEPNVQSAIASEERSDDANHG